MKVYILLLVHLLVYSIKSKKIINVIKVKYYIVMRYNPSNAELNPICHLLALLEVHHILHVSWIRVFFKLYDRH